MKKHAIIPIFVTHEGCPFDCTFCNQNKITAHSAPLNAKEIENTIEEWLSTLTKMNLDTIEIAFFGGSFTGIPLEKQCEFLEVAKRYKDKGIVQKLHLSTRPDYINDKILINLKNYSVDVIELGVQSFDDEVLELSNRGYKHDIVYSSCELIKSYGFELGIQLMIGLPEDSLEKCIYSAKETAKIAPDLARLYPLVVIKDTQLYEDYLNKTFKPIDLEESIFRTKEMYKIIDVAGINIIRVGLKSSDIIKENGDIAVGTFHPAFRQLVEGDIAYDIITTKLEEKLNTQNNNFIDVEIFSNNQCMSNAVGNAGRNKERLSVDYPVINFYFIVNNSLNKNEYEVNVTDI
ncbi:MAG: radical SAM protein [Peptostreptococcaceae bacterium]|nr:radical SAM protein [Peptostreptococcaceae bacterium]